MSKKLTVSQAQQQPIVVMEISSQMLQQHESSTSLERQKTNALGEEAQQMHRSRLSFRHYLRELLEATLALGIVSVVGLFLPPLWLQSHLIFCVFFLLVFVLAIRSHALTTYITGFLVAGCYSLLLWQKYQANQSFAMLQMFTEPFLLFVSSIVISEMLCAQKHKIEIAEQQHIQKETFFQEIKRRYQGTKALNEKLELQFSRAAISVSTVNEKMALLWRLRGQEQYNAILDIVMHALDARFCALYMLCDGRMSLCASQAENAQKYPKTFPINLDLNDTLISRTIQSRQVCTIHDTLADSRSTKRAVAMMAGPLVDHHNQIVGVVIVDDIPLLKFLPTKVRLFSSLLHLTSIAVQTALPDTEAKSGESAINSKDAINNDYSMQSRTEYALPVVRPRYHTSK